MFLLAGLGWSLAQTCDNPKSEFDSLYCVVQEFQQADKELNDAYKELLAKLNPEGQGLLRNSQRAWIRQRDRASAATLEGKTVFYMDTATVMTKERTAFLKARLRECNSTGCLNAKLR
jgi:soluble lytic murein transglycosylase